MQSTENWKPVVGYEGLYEVSNLGHVRSLDRIVMRSDGGARRFRGQIMATVTRDTGHVVLTLRRDGGVHLRRVHRLVLESFVGPCPSGMEACHNDGDPANNRLDNLRWDTRSENQNDSVQHGTQRNARKTHCPLGHVLGGANLVETRNGRECRACKNGRGYARLHGIPFTAELAHERYRV